MNTKIEQFLANIEASEEWEELVSTGMEIREEFDQKQWIYGDLAEKVYQKWGSQGLNAYAITIFEEKRTLKRYQEVASKIDNKLRDKYKDLSWSHFRVASSREDPEKALKLASDNGWSVENMVMQMKKLDGKPVAPLAKVRIVECAFCRKMTLYGPEDSVCSNFKDCSHLVVGKVK